MEREDKFLNQEGSLNEEESDTKHEAQFEKNQTPEGEVREGSETEPDIEAFTDHMLEKSENDADQGIAHVIRRAKEVVRKLEEASDEERSLVGKAIHEVHEKIAQAIFHFRMCAQEKKIRAEGSQRYRMEITPEMYRHKDAREFFDEKIKEHPFMDEEVTENPAHLYMSFDTFRDKDNIAPPLELIQYMNKKRKERMKAEKKNRKKNKKREPFWRRQRQWTQADRDRAVRIAQATALVLRS